MNTHRGYDAIVAAIREAMAKHPDLVTETPRDVELTKEAVLYLAGWPVAEERLRGHAPFLTERDCRRLQMVCEVAETLGLDSLVDPARLASLQDLVVRLQQSPVTTH